ncbi:MAG: histidine phosphatase family protein [Solirubrobacterales bacterium]|nr:histidine phosphatase family protein [Solirubrobacterales bacterium]
MAGSDDVLLARHGETDDNAAGRFQGRRDPPLNETGRAQARDLAVAVAGAGLVALYASPLARARETAEIISAAIGLQPVYDERFMEADVGDWAGLLYEEVVAGSPGAFEAWRAADPSFRFPGGESVGEQAERVAAAIADVRAAGRLPALIVCHGGTIRAAFGLGVPGDAIANGSVHRLHGALP